MRSSRRTASRPFVRYLEGKTKGQNPSKINGGYSALLEELLEVLSLLDEEEMLSLLEEELDSEWLLLE